MSGAIGSILVLGVLIIGGWIAWQHKDEILAALKSGTGVSPTPSSSPTQPQSPSITTTNASCNPNLVKAISHPNDAGMRLQFNGCISVTGTVVGKAPHYAPDGDMVFAVKLDPEFAHYVNAKNNNPKMAGGIWCEAVCQSTNNSKDSWHKGDCSAGGPFPKFKMPKLGDRLRVTGIHTIDNGEGGHAEIHPVSNIEFIGGAGTSSATTTNVKKSKAHFSFVYDGNFHYPEVQEISTLYNPY